MNERRRFRRSSPDAPQGVVPVVTVFAGLVAVVVIAGASFVSANGSTTKQLSQGGNRVRGKKAAAGSTTVPPTTALIRGQVTSTLFVTTTTPITTTTSTTSTTVPDDALDLGATEVVFKPGQTSVSVTVNSPDPDGIDFTVNGVPPGMEASPRQGTVSATSPVTLTLRITNPDRARSGTLILVGNNGALVTVKVTIRTDDLAVAAVSTDPSPPVCGSPARLEAAISGDDIRSVVATLTSPGGGRTISLNGSGSGTWTATLPDGSANTTVTGSVVVTASDGTTASRAFSVTYADGPECR